MELNPPQDVVSLAELSERPEEHLERMRRSGRPEILAVNGKARLVVQDPDSYQKLLELADQADAVRKLREAFESFDRGEGRPAREAFEELRQKHGIPR